MTIPWIPCAEIMPPEFNSKIILKTDYGSYSVTDGESLSYDISDAPEILDWEWTPYDEATWRELNAMPDEVFEKAMKENFEQYGELYKKLAD